MKLFLVEEATLPKTPISHSQVMSECEKIKAKGSSWINIGYMKKLKLAANFEKGKFNKFTGGNDPVVKAIKISEAQYMSAINYANLKAVKERNATAEYQQRLADRQSKIDAGELEPPRGIEWIIPNVLGRTSRGTEVITVIGNPKNRPRVEYYISVNDEPYRKTDKEEIANYMTPAVASEFLAPAQGADELPADSSERIPYRTLNVENIYALAGEGETYMMRHRPAKKVADEVKVDEPVADNTESAVNESCKKSLKEDWYRGCQGVKYVYHGDWADPELIYDGVSFNYWDIEDALWNDFLDETGYSDADSNDPKIEKEFDKYVQEHCIDEMEDWIDAGYVNESINKHSRKNGIIESYKAIIESQKNEIRALRRSIRRK